MGDGEPKKTFVSSSRESSPGFAREETVQQVRVADTKREDVEQHWEKGKGSVRGPLSPAWQLASVAATSVLSE